jgi:formate hydrogenlyase transcriptional activator
MHNPNQPAGFDDVLDHTPLTIKNKANRLPLLLKEIARFLNIDFVQIIFGPYRSATYSFEYHYQTQNSDILDFAKFNKRYLEENISNAQLLIYNRSQLPEKYIADLPSGILLSFEQYIFMPVIAASKVLGIFTFCNSKNRTVDTDRLQSIRNDWSLILSGILEHNEAKSANKYIPLLCESQVIHLDKNDFISGLIEDHLKVIEEISNKFYTDVSHHLSNETSQADDGEKAILLSLSNDLAKARNKIDLFEVVNTKLKNLFSIAGFAIALISDDDNTYGVYVYDVDDNIRNFRGFNDVITQNYSVSDGLFEQVISSVDPVILNVDELSIPYGDIAYVRLWREVGIQKIVAVALRVGGRNLGCLYFHTELDLYQKLRLNLLKAVCAQFSLAICNILSIEEIAGRVNERELLLSINTDLATVRSNEELVQVIRQKISDLIGCKHTLIGTINEDKTTASAFITDPQAKAREHPAYQVAKKGKYPIADGILDNAMGSALPLIFDLDQVYTWKEMPLYTKLNYEFGIRQLVIIRLSKRNDVFGFWMLFFEEKRTLDPGKLKLIESLSNQISVSVSNLIANDEIKKREEEKTRLLSLSNAIASVRNKHVLFDVLKQQLSELFSINNYTIYTLNEDKTKHMPMLYDAGAKYTAHPDWSKMIDTWTDINDGVFNIILASEGMILFNVDEWYDLPNPPVYAKVAKDFGAKTMIGIAIRLGAENIGVMNFNHNDFAQIKNQEYLLKSICSLIAIAVSNIMANEKVNKHLSEIEKYKQRLEEETIYLKEEIQITQNYAEIIGESLAVQKTFRMVSQVAPSDSTVLILGETGTGKELIARAIHNNSPRKNKLMVKVNCAALPANLIESELFGHERGSFTGATERRLGKFELAHNGTLFLDEIGEMPLELQVKLLRALQEKEIERVGGRNPIKVDVRIIAATNRDLEKEMEDGRFRSDLFYRLNIFPIYISPLRDRKEDIPILATHFIHRFSKKVGRKITTLSNRVLQDLMQYNWPGNVRELEHLIERSVLLSTGDTLKQIYLPSTKQNVCISQNEEVVIKTIDENERDHILKILKHCKGRISGSGGAAEILGLPTSTLNSRIKKLGIKKEHL